MQYTSPFPGFRKSLILSRREQELRHALRNNHPPAKLERAAERVRVAQLHLLKALHHAAVPCRAEDAPAANIRLEKLEAERELWERRSLASILEEFTRVETHARPGGE